MGPSIRRYWFVIETSRIAQLTSIFFQPWHSLCNLCFAMLLGAERFSLPSHRMEYDPSRLVRLHLKVIPVAQQRQRGATLRVVSRTAAADLALPRIASHSLALPRTALPFPHRSPPKTRFWVRLWHWACALVMLPFTQFTHCSQRVL